MVGTRNNNNPAGDSFEGCLDDLAIWTEVLPLETIEALAAGASPIGATGPLGNFRITNFSYDPASGDFSITWNSEEGAFYRIAYEIGALGAPNDTPWDIDLDDGYEGEAGDSTTFTFNRADLINEAQTASRVNFRIELIDN